MAAAPQVTVAVRRASSSSHEGPQSKYWFITVTNLEGPPDPAWPQDVDGRRRRPLALRREHMYRVWRVPQSGLARMEAVRLTAEMGANNPEDPQAGLLHLHLCIKTKSKIRSQPLRLLLGLEPYQYHSEVLHDADHLRRRAQYLTTIAGVSRDYIVHPFY